jgi:hypothetical protein
MGTIEARANIGIARTILCVLSVLWLSLPSHTAAQTTSTDDTDPMDASDPAHWRPAEGSLLLLRTPPIVAGNLLGAAGLITAASVATLGDGIALVDRNRVSRGVFSASIHRVAEALSWTGTSALELLRGEDVERWPEATATYRLADPFIGRLDTSLSGLAALRLAVTDALLAPLGGAANLVGASTWADRVEARRRDDRIFYLGPPPIAAAADPTS